MDNPRREPWEPSEKEHYIDEVKKILSAHRVTNYQQILNDMVNLLLQERRQYETNKN